MFFPLFCFVCVCFFFYVKESKTKVKLATIIIVSAIVQAKRNELSGEKKSERNKKKIIKNYDENTVSELNEMTSI